MHEIAIFIILKLCVCMATLDARKHVLFKFYLTFLLQLHISKDQARRMKTACFEDKEIKKSKRIT